MTRARRCLYPIGIVILLSCSHDVSLFSMLLFEGALFFQQLYTNMLHSISTLNSRKVFTWENCQPAQPDSISGIITQPAKAHSSKTERYNSTRPQFPLFLYTLQTNSSLKNWAVWHVWGCHEEWCKCGGIKVCAVQSSSSKPSFSGGQTQAFLPKHVHPVLRQNTHYHSAMGQHGPHGDNN